MTQISLGLLCPAFIVYTAGSTASKNWCKICIESSLLQHGFFYFFTIECCVAGFDRHCGILLVCHGNVGNIVMTRKVYSTTCTILYIWIQIVIVMEISASQQIISSCSGAIFTSLLSKYDGNFTINWIHSTYDGNFTINWMHSI
jgi:hypothetical protein